ncbi:MAG: DNA polymerase I [Candidatus Omnitrophica bacterium]|nr:DNA polymerase I [Candidatus Omnitrophota bacterium]
MKDIYLIDGSNLIYRSFYAIKDLRTSSGKLTNAIYGFTSTLLKILKERKPDYICVLFDLKAPTMRHDAFAGYKAQRKPMPDELVEQLPLIKKMSELLGIKQIGKEGYEADDLIATLAGKFRSGDSRIFIVTGDKDIMQILDENIFMLNPDGWKTFTVDDFREKYGLNPSAMPDIIGLAGDSSDNIPGVYGIGEKTALKLLSEYKTLENLYENLLNISQEKTRMRLEENRENAFMSKELAILKKDADVDVKAEDILISEPDAKELLETIERLEFRKLAAQIKELYPSVADSCMREDVITASTGESVSLPEIKTTPSQFREFFENEGVEKYGFNLKDAITFLAGKGISFRNPAFDFAVARHLTGKIPDAADCLSLLEKYRQTLKEMEIERLFYGVEMPLVKTLSWMEMSGIKTDRKFLEQLTEELNGELKILQDRIYMEAGEVFNINSSQQLAAILFERLKLPVQRKTKTGYSTDTSVLQELADKHPLPKLLLEYRELYKLKSTYAEGLIPFISPADGRIYPTFSQVSTSTGRLSCSNPNLQNIPVRTERGSQIRRAFSCEEGNILYSFDYNQIELRILADFSDDPYLVNAFRQNKDVHSETAEILFSQDSLFTPSTPSAGKKDRRRMAKTINFGVLYGMSPYGLSKELKIPVSDAENFIKEYFSKFKGIKNYIDRTLSGVEKDGYVSTVLKRRRYIPDIKSANKNLKEFAKRAAINMPVQGSAADLIKLAMNGVYEYFIREKLKSRMVLQIHDELLFEVCPGEEKKIAENVKNIMENVLPLKVPIKADVKHGPNYLDMVGL